MKKIITILCLLFSFSLYAKAQVKQVVKFPKGKESITLKSSVVGNKYVDFIVKVSNNQVLSAKVLGKKVAFTIIEPDGEQMADTYGIREITTQIDVAGTYKIRVMREDSSSNKAKTTFSIFIEVVNMK